MSLLTRGPCIVPNYKLTTDGIFCNLGHNSSPPLLESVTHCYLAGGTITHLLKEYSISGLKYGWRWSRNKW